MNALPKSAWTRIYNLLSPHGTDRSVLAKAEPSLAGFHLRHLARCANRIASEWKRARQEPPNIRRSPPRRDIGVYAYPRSFILREIRSKLYHGLICALPEFLLMIVASGRYAMSDRERCAIRDVRSALPERLGDRRSSMVLGRLAVESRLSNRVIANAAMLAARVGRLQ